MIHPLSMIVKKTVVNVQHHFRVFIAKLEQVTEFSINVLRSVIIKPSFQAHSFNVPLTWIVLVVKRMERLRKKFACTKTVLISNTKCSYHKNNFQYTWPSYWVLFLGLWLWSDLFRTFYFDFLLWVGLGEDRVVEFWFLFMALFEKEGLIVGKSIFFNKRYNHFQPQKLNRDISQFQ